MSYLEIFWEYYFQLRQLVKSLVIVICLHIVKVYNSYAQIVIIYEVNRHFTFLPIIYFP